MYFWKLNDFIVVFYLEIYIFIVVDYMRIEKDIFGGYFELIYVLKKIKCSFIRCYYEFEEEMYGSKGLGE